MVGIVLEFASGGALDDALGNSNISKDWTWKDPFLRISTDVAQGMRYLHNTTYFDEKLKQQVTSVIHRDLKPGNVLLSTSFTAKVADFGSSKAMTGEADLTMTGTPIYMAPEIVRGEQYDGKADVYSFAVLMFALTCKKGNAFAAFEASVRMRSSFFGSVTQKALEFEIECDDRIGGGNEGEGEGEIGEPHQTTTTATTNYSPPQFAQMENLGLPPDRSCQRRQWKRSVRT